MAGCRSLYPCAKLLTRESRHSALEVQARAIYAKDNDTAHSDPLSAALDEKAVPYD